MAHSDETGTGRACPDRVDLLVELTAGGAGGNPELDRHLDTCPGCSDYVRWLHPAADLLGEAVPHHNPPAELKRRVMSEVRANPTKARPSLARVRPSIWARPRVALVAVACVAVGAGAVFALSGTDESTLRTEPVLAKTAGSPIEGALIRDGDSGVLELEALPQLGENRVYQVWIRSGTTVAPSTIFVADRTREAEATIPGGLENADEVLVTAEPAGGSATPSTDPVIGVPLT